jgi:hypothetical protein
MVAGPPYICADVAEVDVENTQTYVVRAFVKNGFKRAERRRSEKAGDSLPLGDELAISGRARGLIINRVRAGDMKCDEILSNDPDQWRAENYAR